jgi:hypothetical protein
MVLAACGSSGVRSASPSMTTTSAPKALRAAAAVATGDSPDRLALLP